MQYREMYSSTVACHCFLMHYEQPFRSSCHIQYSKGTKNIKIPLIRIPVLCEPTLWIYVDRCPNSGKTRSLCLPHRSVSRQGEHNRRRKWLMKNFYGKILHPEDRNFLSYRKISSSFHHTKIGSLFYPEKGGSISSRNVDANQGNQVNRGYGGLQKCIPSHQKISP